MFAQAPQGEILRPYQETPISALYASAQPSIASSTEVSGNGQFDGISGQSGVEEGLEESGLEAYIRLEAKNYGVSESLALFIVQNESGFDPKIVGDEHLTCPTTGLPQRSRGWWQWNDCYNPQVSDEQAFNFIDSTELAMKELAKGEERCKQLWTTCRKYYAQTQTD